MKNFLLPVCFLFAFALSAAAHDSWARVGDFTAKGAQEIPVNQYCDRIEFQNVGGNVAITTVWVREGGKKTEHTLARGIAPKEKVSISFPAANVTGLRISFSGGGTCRILARKASAPHHSSSHSSHHDRREDYYYPPQPVYPVQQVVYPQQQVVYPQQQQLVYPAPQQVVYPAQPVYPPQPAYPPQAQPVYPQPVYPAQPGYSY